MNDRNDKQTGVAPDQRNGPQGRGAKDEGMEKPQWADSLRNLYDSVVDEPIPDTFKDLLAQLDDPGKGDGKA
tara:strand:- start:447 stop:662 length:216 start_codon:yes stop_codon:yes gene_type:complete